MNRRQLLLSAVAFASLVGCGRNEPIHQPTPLQAIVPKVRLNRVWAQSLGKMGRRDVPGLRIVENDEQIFAAAGNGGVAALSSAGELLWKTNLSSALVSGPAVSPVAELVYLGTARGEVFALRAKTGEQHWKAQLETEVLSVLTVAGRVFVRSADGKLTALDGLDGKVLWVLDHDMPALSVRGMAAPIPVANALALGWEDGFVETVLQVNGERAWDARIALPRGRTDIERMVDVQSSLLTDESRIFAAATNGKVIALDLQTGNQLWASDTSTWVDMALAEQRLFVVAEDDTVKALSTESGRVLWMQDTLKYRRLSKAVAFGSFVAVTDMEGVLHILNGSDGSIIGRGEGAITTGLADGLALTDRRLLLLDVTGNLSLWQTSNTA
jgi:outer membrane protein assembly factor BamB